MPSSVFCVCNFYNGNSTLKRWLVWYRYVRYFCYVGMTQHKQYLMQLCFQFQENCQRYFSMFIYDKSWSNELTILSALKSDSHLPKIVLLFPLLKSLKIDEKCFYFISKALFILKIFKFLPWLWWKMKKQLDWKENFHFEVHDVTIWLTNNYNANIAQYLTK